MKIKLFNWILTIDILTVCLILSIILIPSNFARIILGLPFLLFFPGYVLIAALFPPQSHPPSIIENDEDIPNVSSTKDQKKGIGNIERTALRFGLSIVVTTLLGLGLNYTHWGIRLVPVLITISVFIIIMSIIALIRQRRAPDGLRLSTEFYVKLRGWEGSGFNKTLTVIMVVAILGSICTLAFAITAPKVGERFTEFYILGRDGKAEGYPSLFVMRDNQIVSVQYGDLGTMSDGGPGKITVGIVNREQQNTNFSVSITINGQLSTFFLDGSSPVQIYPISLVPDEKWEQEISFVPQQFGDNQKVEFLLYKNSETQPEDRLHIWINVTKQ